MATITKPVHKKLDGATLIESIVAMVLVLLCFVIASAVFVRVNNSAFLVHQYKAKELVNSWHIQNVSINETEINVEDWFLKREFSLYRQENIWEISYQVWGPSGELKYEEKRLKYIKNREDEVSIEE